MVKLSVALTVCISSFSCLAGELIRDATVIEVANNYSTGGDFAIKLSGGVGVCSGVAWIIFPESKARSAIAHSQAIASAACLLNGKEGSSSQL